MNLTVYKLPIIAKWNIEKSTLFWAERCFETVMIDEHKIQKSQSRDTQRNSRREQQLAHKVQFTSKHCRLLSSSLRGAVIAENLKFWLEHMSWSYCNIWKLLTTECLLPNYFKRPPLKFRNNCTCVKNVYINPTPNKIRDVLKGLRYNDVIALRPFTVHLGDYVMKANGYRQKTNLYRLTWSTHTIPQKLDNLPDERSRQRCSIAYNFHIANEHSDYKHFVQLRETAVSQQKRFNLYDFTKNVGIECALWTNLYPALDVCKTVLIGKENRASTKVAFMTKVFSKISDYATHYELFQFHYDLWLFKTVSGAITTARKTQCLPAKSLEGKPFSSEFWKWQHHYLGDAVKQFGFPLLFITISRSEWSFPLPPWLKQLQELTGLGETDLSAYKTMHFLNTVEQIVRGYLCGSNDKC